MCLLLCTILIARGTSTKKFLTKKIALCVGVFGSIDIIIHLISLFKVMNIYTDIIKRSAGLVSSSVLYLNVLMSMISQILIFYSYFSLYRNKNGLNSLNNLLRKSEVDKSESLAEDIVKKLDLIRQKYSNQRVRQASIIEGRL